jgi:hypothetical protein
MIDAEPEPEEDSLEMMATKSHADRINDLRRKLSVSAEDLAADMFEGFGTNRVSELTAKDAEAFISALEWRLSEQKQVAEVPEF